MSFFYLVSRQTIQVSINT